eukprot:TRINITY_DN5405_c0_g1_i7.p1 TRINITY_DN5405_c0_g1~~TRINITY_DN5405_c0_g1_i7.p1  ORF type:complete len:163 (-),score=41.49 TRINITY_DN5405_c0_g1_i7:73-561(-)
MCIRDRSKEQENRIREVFKIFDKDQNGELTKKELINILLMMYGDSRRVNREVEEIFRNFDLDDKGTITYNEFLVANLKLDSVLNDEILQSAFEFYDTDHNGQITFEEIRKVLGGVYDDKTLKELIIEVDTNKDNQISFPEFKVMMENFRAKLQAQSYRCNTE